MKAVKLPELSLFFPAYNEAGNIEEAIKQALNVLPQIAEKYEVIVVNDGSTDATVQIAKRMAHKYKKIRVVSQKNKGYGGALKLGFKSVRYDWVFYTDSDLQFDLNELKYFLKNTSTQSLVIGYRKRRAEGWKRQIFAVALKIWNNLFLAFPLWVKDIDCAFKLIHRRVLRHVLPLRSDGAMVSTELLLKAYRAGFEFKQIGVNHYLRRTGHPTGNNLKVILQAVKDTFVLQRHLLRASPAARIASQSVRNLRRLGFRFAVEP